MQLFNCSKFWIPLTLPKFSPYRTGEFLFAENCTLLNKSGLLYAIFMEGIPQIYFLIHVFEVFWSCGIWKFSLDIVDRKLTNFIHGQNETFLNTGANDTIILSGISTEGHA